MNGTLNVSSTSTLGGNTAITGTLNVSSTSIFAGQAVFNTGIVPDADEGAYLGTASLPFSEAHIDEIRIGVSGNGEIDTASGNLTLDSTGGTTTVDDNLIVSGTSTLQSNTAITGTLTVTDDITAFFSSDERLKLNITPIENPLAKVRSISGNTFTWIEGGVHEGEDTGVIAQEIAALGLPGLTTIRETGYMAVKYDKLTALLIEAVKELSAKVEILEQKLSDK